MSLLPSAGAQGQRLVTKRRSVFIRIPMHATPRAIFNLQTLGQFFLMFNMMCNKTTFCIVNLFFQTGDLARGGTCQRSLPVLSDGHGVQSARRRSRCAAQRLGRGDGSAAAVRREPDLALRSGALLFYIHMQAYSSARSHPHTHTRIHTHVYTRTRTQTLNCTRLSKY